MIIFARSAYLQNGWAKDVRITVQGNVIQSIETAQTPAKKDIVVDTLLPALCNLHSHSFQRAMAGMTEFRKSGEESFWTWRDLMYQFMEHLTPDHIAAIAAMAFLEMQKAGYAAVGEFHYIHHAKGGVPYENRAELSLQVMQAAHETGIGITHLPVLYSYGDVEQKPLQGGQVRFGNTLDQFCEVANTCIAFAASHTPDAQIGVAPHSLRATSPKDLTHLLTLFPKGPVHIHIAEQMKEVDSVVHALGGRPVEWLLNNADVDERWCLIHATHMSERETQDLARSKAIAGLCPVTEANLGDGIFNGKEFMALGGRFGIGTDSNINIALSEEVRLFEYSQRLKHRERNVLATQDVSTGEFLYSAAALGGARALNRDSGTISVGKLADLVAINSKDPRLCTLTQNQLLDGYLFAANDRVVSDVWCAGRHQVRAGQHIHQDVTEANYRKAMLDLVPRLG